MTRAALYCRLSREDEGLEASAESESIQNQRAMLLAWAERLGYAVQGIYCDEDYSGADRDRPAFNRMLAAARAGQIDVILAKSQSRFTRDMELVEKYLHGLFPLWGVRFLALVDHVDTGDAAGKKSRQIYGLMNEWYLEDLSANVRAVLTHKRRQGCSIASSPLYGYQKDPAQKGHLLPDESTAPVVERIFALALSGLGCAAIARRLNTEGIPAPAAAKALAAGRAPGPGLWTKATVHRLLTNRTYAGDLVQGRVERISWRGKQTRRLPESRWIVAPASQPALVSRAVFDRVQALLSARARSGSRGAPHPLAGLVVCGLCGRLMEQTRSGTIPKSGVPTRYFRCRTARQSPSACPGQPYLPLADLEELIAGRINALFAAAASLPPAPVKPLPPAAGTARRLRLALAGLYQDKAAGLLGEEEFAALRTELLARLRQLEAPVRSAEPPEAPDPAIPPPLGRELAAALIEKILIYPPDPDGNRRLEIFWRV